MVNHSNIERIRAFSCFFGKGDFQIRGQCKGIAVGCCIDGNIDVILGAGIGGRPVKISEDHGGVLEKDLPDCFDHINFSLKNL